MITSPADPRLEETSVISTLNDDRAVPLSITVANNPLYLYETRVFAKPFPTGHVRGRPLEDFGVVLVREVGELEVGKAAAGRGA